MIYEFYFFNLFNRQSLKNRQSFFALSLNTLTKWLVEFNFSFFLKNLL